MIEGNKVSPLLQFLQVLLVNLAFVPSEVALELGLKTVPFYGCLFRLAVLHLAPEEG